MSEILSSILSPVTIEEFSEKYYSKKAFLIQNDTNRFSYLLNWEKLNEILNTSSIESIDLTVNKEKIFPKKKEDITINCEKGATLRITNVNLFDYNLLDFNNKLSEELLSICRMNLYASYPNSQAYPVHHDPYDVFIIQLEGEKYWEISNPVPVVKENNIEPEGYKANIFTLKKWNKNEFLDYRNDEEYNYEWFEFPDKEEPYLTCSLKSGDILYIPRGHWHRVKPQDSASLHLTIGISYRNGINFSFWLLRQLIKDYRFFYPYPLLFNNDEINVNKEQWVNYQKSLKYLIKEKVIKENYYQRYYSEFINEKKNNTKLEFPDIFN